MEEKFIMVGSLYGAYFWQKNVSRYRSITRRKLPQTGDPFRSLEKIKGHGAYF
tara:strand:+ start:769 stop:927 length:159 start_codon:yes stop_codon:yes gene_type:complete